MATCLKLLPCAEFIGWILPQTTPAMMIISNIEGEAFSSFSLAYVTSACKLPTPQVMMNDEWVSKAGLDIVECDKIMMIVGK